VQTLQEQIKVKSKHQTYTNTHTHTHKCKMIFAAFEPAHVMPVDSALEDHRCPLLLVMCVETVK